MCNIKQVGCLPMNPTNCQLQCTNKLLKNISNTLSNSNNEDIVCELETISCTLTDISTILKNIQMSLNTELPTVIQGEYPKVSNDRIVYHYSGLLSSIVGNIVVIFRGVPFGEYETLPVYLMDNSGYSHIVTNGPLDTPPLLGSEIVINTILPAIYIGNYVHIIS